MRIDPKNMLKGDTEFVIFVKKKKFKIDVAKLLKLPLAVICGAENYNFHYTVINSGCGDRSLS
jgi:hypothetical protein